MPRKQKQSDVRSDGRAPEIILLLAIMEQAIQNLCRDELPYETPTATYQSTRRAKVVDELQSDFAWLTSDANGDGSGFAFREVCEYAEVDPETIRQMVISRMNSRVMQEAGLCGS